MRHLLVLVFLLAGCSAAATAPEHTSHPRQVSIALPDLLPQVLGPGCDDHGHRLLLAGRCTLTETAVIEQPVWSSTPRLSNHRYSVTFGVSQPDTIVLGLVYDTNAAQLSCLLPSRAACRLPITVQQLAASTPIGPTDVGEMGFTPPLHSYDHTLLLQLLPLVRTSRGYLVQQSLVVILNKEFAR